MEDTLEGRSKAHAELRTGDESFVVEFELMTEGSTVRCDKLT